MPAAPARGRCRGTTSGTSRSGPSYRAAVDLRLILLALGIALTGCSMSSGSPERACAEPTPGAVTGECRDSGEGEGPLDY